MSRLIGFVVLASCLETACTNAAHAPASGDGGQFTNSEPSIDSSAVRLNKPDLVQSGVATTLHFELTAFALMSNDDITTHLSGAISVVDASGAAIPVDITAADDDRNSKTVVAVSASTPVPANGWYYATVTGKHGTVDLDDGEDSWTLSLYTGDLVYVEYLSRPTDPAKLRELSARFTQPVDFDAAWSAIMLGDENGAPIAACAPINGACAQSGHITTQDIQLQLPAGGGSNVQRFFPGVLGMHLGGPALAPGSAPPQVLPDGSVSLVFQLCPQRDSECAYF